MLFRKKIQPSCSYCAHGGKVNEDTVLCRKKGLVNACGQCRGFKYEPLKRIPLRPKAKDFSKYQDEDFSL